MKSVITGVAGFIGSSLAEQLLVRGHDVIGIDDLAGNYDAKIKEKNLETLSAKSRFVFVKEDVLNSDLEKHFQGADHVYHEAALTGVEASWNNVEEYTRNNIFSTAKLLGAAKKAKVRKIVFASSASVYGSLSLFPFKEAFPVRPLTPYAITKMKSEELCLMYYREDRLPVVILRYFTVYGPRQRPDMAMQNMILSALRGDEFVIRGDGKQERDLIYISDAVNTTIRAAEMGGVGEIYNVGSGTSTSLLGLIKMVEEISGKKIKTVNKPPIKGDMQKTTADTGKLTGELMMAQGIDLKAGIQKQIDWIKKSI